MEVYREEEEWKFAGPSWQMGLRQLSPHNADPQGKAQRKLWAPTSIMHVYGSGEKRDRVTLAFSLPKALPCPPKAVCSAGICGGANWRLFATCKGCTYVAGSATREPLQSEAAGAEDPMWFPGFTLN